MGRFSSLQIYFCDISGISAKKFLFVLYRALSLDKTHFDQTAWDENKMPKGYRKEHQ